MGWMGYCEIHERLSRTMRAVRATPDRLDELMELLPAVDKLSTDDKWRLEMSIEVFIRRLQDHQDTWRKVLEASRQRRAGVRRAK